MTFAYLCCTSSNLGTTPPKLLPISTEHGEKSPRGIEQYKCGSGNSGVVMRKDEKGRGRLGSLENEQLHAVVEQNPRQSVREMSQTLGVSIATVSHHLKIIGKVKKLDKWVPHELNENQKLRRFEVCSMLSLCATTMIPFLTELSLVTKSGSFMITVNDQVNGSIVMSPPNTS
ncbi:hypothetical protein FHG87_022404 [Trinorchestia longiramus]|nr:hypothetical protein FHG87_022404 [Trinorchestia longiramus]